MLKVEEVPTTPGMQTVRKSQCRGALPSLPRIEEPAGEAGGHGQLAPGMPSPVPQEGSSDLLSLAPARGMLSIASDSRTVRGRESSAGELGSDQPGPERQVWGVLGGWESLNPGGGGGGPS